MTGGLTLLLSLIAFGFALAAWNRALRESARAEQLQRRLDVISAALARLQNLVQAPQASPPPSSPTQEPASAPSSPAASPLRELVEAKTRQATIAPPPLPLTPAAPPQHVAVKTDSLSPPVAKPPAAKASLEEKLTLRVFVWIAAVALALAGGYLVKYSFDNSILTAPVRISIAVLAGLGMIGAGEVMLRRYRRIAQALSAAGVATLFAALLAAVHVEKLLPPSLGFAAMAAVAGAAVVLSLRQGQLVAILGLAGGFLTPAIVSTGERSASMLFGYLFVLQLALLLVTRRRAWWPLTLLTLVCGYGWVAAWLAFLYAPGDETALGLFLLGTGAAFVLAPLGAAADEADAILRAAVRWAGAAAGMLLGGAMLPVGTFTTIEWVYFGILGGGCLAVAMFDARNHALAWLAAAAGAVVLLMYGSDAPDQFAFNTVVATFGVLYAGGGYAGLWIARRHQGSWAALSVAAAATYFTLAWWGVLHLPFERFWGVTALGLAVTYAAAAWPVLRRSLPAASAALLLGAIGFLAAAVPLELERQWIAVAWALLVPAAIEIGRRLGVPAMRWAAMALTVGVVVRLLLNPAVLEYPIGAWPVLNWLLYGYGIPVVAMIVAAWRVGGDAEAEDGDIGKVFTLVAVALALAMITLMVRHGFHRAQLDADTVSLVELATYALAWTGMGVGMLLMSRRRPSPLLSRCGGLIAAAGSIIVAALVCLALNPLWRFEAVGDRAVINWLLYIYGLPAAAALGAIAIARRDARPVASALFVVGLVLLFTLVTLQVRHAFHGQSMSLFRADRLTHAENYAYSAAWMIFGVGLLVVGIVARSPALRWASLAVVMLSVAKVFVWDMAHLRDLYRVLSFFGLGVALLGLAWLYQRFVFRRQEA